MVPLVGNETCLIYAICCLYFLSFRNKYFLGGSFYVKIVTDVSNWLLLSNMDVFSSDLIPGKSYEPSASRS